MYADYEMLEQARKLDLFDYATTEIEDGLQEDGRATMIHITVGCLARQQQTTR